MRALPLSHLVTTTDSRRQFHSAAAGDLQVLAIELSLSGLAAWLRVLPNFGTVYDTGLGLQPYTHTRHRHSTFDTDTYTIRAD